MTGPVSRACPLHVLNTVLSPMQYLNDDNCYCASQCFYHHSEKYIIFNNILCIQTGQIYFQKTPATPVTVNLTTCEWEATSGLGIGAVDRRIISHPCYLGTVNPKRLRADKGKNYINVYYSL
jgi:hypothetical protein